MSSSESFVWLGFKTCFYSWYSVHSNSTCTIACSVFILFFFPPSCISFIHYPNIHAAITPRALCIPCTPPSPSSTALQVFMSKLFFLDPLIFQLLCSFAFLEVVGSPYTWFGFPSFSDACDLEALWRSVLVGRSLEIQVSLLSLHLVNVLLLIVHMNLTGQGCSHFGEGN